MRPTRLNDAAVRLWDTHIPACETGLAHVAYAEFQAALKAAEGVIARSNSSDQQLALAFCVRNLWVAAHVGCGCPQTHRTVLKSQLALLRDKFVMFGN